MCVYIYMYVLVCVCVCVFVFFVVCRVPRVVWWLGVVGVVGVVWCVVVDMSLSWSSLSLVLPASYDERRVRQCMECVVLAPFST